MKQLKISFCVDIFFIYLTLFAVICGIKEFNNHDVTTVILPIINLILASYWTSDAFINWNELKKELNK